MDATPRAALERGKRVLRVSPGFAAVPLSAGEHTVVVGYTPGPLKPCLLIAGFVAFAICAWRAAV